ncbi:D-2-hydroxyacid dehydrogenase [Sporosarcina sp. BI001-red]|uniref:D-2-hydroxyacid dehydrogenase n=1 Tax=Sporosarcina sp. BI001-red TaxID=2282866 RepID=UPI000E275B34|nr:D-2-hydroxyacid dehydrogenase [Sporosarcina sp. BI001-red]REB05326.1 D-2-hydroxyacid dehydrogenase [Sporosarcina sp. BI001-red]
MTNALITFPIKEKFRQELIEQFPQVHFDFSDAIEGAGGKKVTILVTYGSDLTEEILDQLTELKWVMVASAGVDKMPLEKLGERGILVTNVSGIHKTPMAESVLAHILSLNRALPIIQEQQKQKVWEKMKSSELRGSKALILGPGAIGGEIGRLLQAFGVYTIGCSRSGRDHDGMDEDISFANINERLSEADYIISVLPSTQETRWILDSSHFHKMKQSSVFMNFGRGDLVKEQVIVEALQQGEIAHAVLDVFEHEPLPVESVLWELGNCTVSPHVSALSAKYVERALEIFKQNLQVWLTDDGEFKNVIETKRGY